MKRKIIFGASFLLIAWAVNSCESLSDCGYCKDVIYENNVVVNSGPETEFCGVELIKRKATPPLTTGSQVTKVECR